MADHQSSYASSHGLSPQLSTVLGSLNISLEAELNRYRRNRRFDGLVEEDLFAELEDPSFDLDAMERAVEASVAHTATLARPITPPPVPKNKKLAAHLESNTATPSTETSSALAIAKANFSSERSSELRPSTQPNGLAISDQSYATSYPGIEEQTAGFQSASTLVPHQETGATSHPQPGSITPTGYLASSEKLIESLAEVPPMPDPVDTTSKPKRKTVSLLAGATLGFFGLAAGLGASYLMANPLVTQRLASSFQGKETEVAVEQKKAFDPPGPDLSANEFIDLEIDNLSSLKMPQTAGVPSIGTTGDISAAGLENPATANALPPIAPIEGAVANNVATAPATSQVPTRSSAPVAPATIETQAVVVPVGLTYYVTAPSSTEQNLVTIRESVSEAFTRRFADGDRVQIAAFDNPQAAQAFVEELKAKNITAQIYGPTTE